MSSQQFLRDRERGKEGQRYVAEMFRSWHWNVYEVLDGYFQPYDLIVTAPNGNKRTVEVKYDLKASTTGNICLELEALCHSKADLLAIVTDDPLTVYITPLQQALALAHSWPNKKKVGEYSLDAALIPRQVFIDKLNPQILTTNKWNQVSTSRGICTGED